MLVSGYPYELKKNCLSADLVNFEHGKILELLNQPVVKIYNFFFLNESFPNSSQSNSAELNVVKQVGGPFCLNVAINLFLTS